MNSRNNEVTIRDFRLEDVPLKVSWINNPEMNRHLHYHIPLNEEDTRRWFRQKDNQTRRDCVIEYRGTPVGLIGLLCIDRTNRKAEYYVSLGEAAYEHLGIASAATRLILDYAFFELELNKVYLNVDAENEAACRLYLRNGFQCEGVFREDLLHHGRLIDRKRFAMLRADYLKIQETTG